MDKSLQLAHLLNTTDKPYTDNSLLHTDYKVTTEEFVAMVIGSYKGAIKATHGNCLSGYMEYALYKGLIEDYDRTHTKAPIERRCAARIVHEVLLTEFKEQDEYEWSAAENLKDLYSCHTCVIHIAQMYVKGIILDRSNDIFDVTGGITFKEAFSIVERMLYKEQRIPQTKRRKIQSKHLSPDEAWVMMQTDNTTMLVDVRTKEEYRIEHIQGSICIPLQDITNNPFSICDKKDIPLILYCQKGYKSSIAAQTLIDGGYKKIYTIPGIDQYEYSLV